MRSPKAKYNQQQGHILILSALIIFILASLSIAPIMHFMGTGIRTAKNAGLHTQEIYAAEAGVYDSIWKIIYVAPGLPKWESNPPLNYAIAGGVNDKSVNITLSKINLETYRICSAATDPNTNHISTVESDITIGVIGGLDLSPFSIYALCSPGAITTKLSDTITGDVWVESSANYSGVAPNGDFVISEITGWPTEIQLEAYFSYLVDISNPFSGGTIDVTNPALCGPLYAQGASNGNYTLTGTGNLTGTIWVEGNLYIDHNAVVSLNGKCIYVTGSISSSPQSSIAGPGAILALGDIVFSPQVTPSFLFVMSVNGGVNFQPSGGFVGSVSGKTGINMQPNCSITWQNPGIGNLDLPGLYNHITSIKSWSIK